MNEEAVVETNTETPNVDTASATDESSVDAAAVKRAQTLYKRISDAKVQADFHKEKVKDCEKRVVAYEAEIRNIICNPGQLSLLPPAPVADAAPAEDSAPTDPPASSEGETADLTIDKSQVGSGVAW